MNYDLNTAEGMKNSSNWLQTTIIDNVQDGGTWLVPRSATVIHMNKRDRVATITAQGKPDVALEPVFEALGWVVTYK